MHERLPIFHFCALEWVLDEPQQEPDVTNELLDLATQAGRALQSKRLMLATAESCTGGGVAQAVTEVAGSTGWFDCGFVVYSNVSKTELLEVSAALIAQHGTVSEEVAAAEPQAPEDVSRAVSAAGLLQERRLVLTRLRHLGVHVLEANAAETGPALVSAYLGFKRRGLL